jgi:alpha-1,3-rhamnosyl/mannosyltransferase
MWLPFEFLVRQRADLHLFPAFIGWPSLFKTPSIAVIHDLAYLDIPESVSARNRADLMAFVPKTLHISRYALTVSDATAQRLRAVYGAGVPPTITTHIPLSPLPEISPAEITEVKTKYRIENDFILFVGTLEPRKNILGALEAYTELPAALRKTHSLVLAGAIGWNSNAIERRIAELQSQGYDIVQTGYVDTVSKVALYRSAAAFLLPSFYEGFGMPILEAMSYGLPCVVSDIPVFHEVAGTAAIFCNPHDSHDIARQLTRVLDNAATRTKYALLARQRSREYVSWDAIADLVYPVIADITEEK